MKKLLHLFFFFTVCSFYADQLRAQCGPIISTFPYSEGFETNAAWTSGVVSGTNDWAWGSPSHPNINAAGGGLKCWCVGNLTGSSYLNSDQCYIMSPCFDFSTLTNPWVSFKIFWECERQWDGMVFQYSLNGGVTWSNVGAFGDPVDCLNQNWYNYGNITWLNSLPSGSRQGWSGRTGATASTCLGGFGSNGWVTAKHCMSYLAHQPNVRFRFLFGSGTSCNAFDGEAVDNIFIDNAPPNVANFSWTCAGGNTVNFSNLSTGCPTSYTWNFNDPSSLGANTSTLTNPSHTFTGPGTYAVVLTANGPCALTGTITIPITILGATISSTTVSCFGGNNGSATANVVGGTGPFTYAWSPTGGSNQTATGLSAGTYTVSITAANSCPITQSISITQPTLLNATITSTNNLCFGGSSGSASVIASGGTSTYSYSWSPSGGSGSTASGLGNGAYTCTITDLHGCVTTQSATITSPTALSVTPTQTDVTCFGGNNGSANVVITGGSPGYTYAWNPSGGNSSNASGLIAGTYTCSITDNNGCTVIQPINITQATLVTTTISTTFASCSISNGTATVVATGGVGPYSYSWSPSGGTGSTATGLAPGTYIVTVTSTGGCTVTATATISNPAPVTSTISSVSNVLCFGGNSGTATGIALTGIGPYTYAWTPTGGNASTATGLIAGNYSITITDANNCSSTSTITITEPAALFISSTSTNVDCFGNSSGSGSVQVTGGVPSYSYAWSPNNSNSSSSNGLAAGTYSCTATDNNGCTITQSLSITEPTQLILTTGNTSPSCHGVCDGQALALPSGGTFPYSYLWSSGCSSAVCNNSCAGNYFITISDANGCTASASTTVTEPNAITITTTSTDAHCSLSDGTVTVNASGGIGTLNYQWATGPSTSNWNNIPSSTYSVVVTDSNGCSDSTSVQVNNLPGVVATISSSTNLTCFNSNDGAIATTISGASGPVTYSWSPNVSSTNTASGLSASTYFISVTDSIGCASSVSVTITQPNAIILTTSPSQSLCAGSTAQLSAACMGGTPAYTFTWFPGSLAGNTPSVSPIASTNYTVYVVDAHGCSDSTYNFIRVNPIPTATFTSDLTNGCAPLCVNFSDLSTVNNPGMITAWIWNFGDGSNVSNAQNPHYCYGTPGSYTVTLDVKTTDGCTANVALPAYINVYANPIADFSASPQPTSIIDPEIFFADASTNAVAWKWYFGDEAFTTSTFQNPSHIYQNPICYDASLSVTSANGCKDSISKEICIKPEITLYAPNAFTPNHDGINDFFFPMGEGIDWNTYHLLIFDRWGNLIFESTDINKPWDGKAKGGSEIAVDDVYVWKIFVRDEQGNEHNLIGHVSLIR